MTTTSALTAGEHSGVLTAEYWVCANAQRHHTSLALAVVQDYGYTPLMTFVTATYNLAWMPKCLEPFKEEFGLTKA